jgi:hypothetical protein
MDYEERVRNHAAEMVGKLLKEVAGKDSVEIHFGFGDEDQWSFISMHEEDNEISLQLHASDRFNIYVGYYDTSDEFFEITQALGPETVNAIPKGLRKIMQKVLIDERGMRVPGKLLLK